jgi:glycosyltransferase involved in cell wall biosynthesis
MVEISPYSIPGATISKLYRGSAPKRAVAGVAGIGDAWINFLKISLRRLDFDALMTFGYCCHYLRHPRMIVYFLSHDKIAYDTSYLAERDLTAPERFGRELYAANRRVIDKSVVKRLREGIPVFAASRNVARRLHKYWQVSPRRVIYPGGFDPSFYYESRDYVLYFGRLDWNGKRMRLVYEVAERLPEIPFVVAGGPVHPLVNQAVFDPPPNVKLRLFQGLCPPEEKRRIYARASCILFPTYDEDFGIVPIEGMSAGKPCVGCTDGGGVTETVIHGKTGLLVPPTVDSLVKAVSELHRFGESMKSDCRKRAEVFRWDACLSQLAAEVEKVL